MQMTAKMISIQNAALYEPLNVCTMNPIARGVIKPANWPPVFAIPILVPVTEDGNRFSMIAGNRRMTNEMKMMTIVWYTTNIVTLGALYIRYNRIPTTTQEIAPITFS